MLILLHHCNIFKLFTRAKEEFGLDNLVYFDSSMNKIKIYGGLGNQMFQYALCIALNHKGKKSRISFSNFLFEFHHNGFNLSKAFRLKFPFPSNLLNYLLLYCEFLYKNRYFTFITKRIIPLYHKRYHIAYYEEKEFVYDPKIFQQESRLLIGIWQVESYFKDIKYLIHKEFAFIKPTDNVNIELVRKINSCNSISIHFRKGDYESINWKSTLGYVNDTNYYFKALEYIREKIGNAYFFIFSDDMEWVKENFKMNSNCTYINHNLGKYSYIDMYLMSLCKHNIIANSTFSWWGAWLNKNENKIVIMPEKWIIRDYYPEGIFPEEWIKINEE